MTIGQFLKAKRKVAKLNQTQVALVMGVTQPAVSRWENDGGVPTFDQMRKLSIVLGFKLADVPTTSRAA